MIVEDGESFMREALGAETMAEVDRRTELFNSLAKDFSCLVGKEESRRERTAKGLQEVSLTYGEVEFRTLYLVFKWI